MNVLITYGWCRTAYSVAMSLARAGHSVSVCSSSRLSMTRFSRFVRSFDHVPDSFEDQRGYVTALGEIARRRDIQVIMPVHEDAFAIQFHRALLPQHVKIACPSLDHLALALDKGRFLSAARDLGLPIPKSVLPRSTCEAEAAFETLGFPLVIKPRHGNSGKGVTICHTIAQARREYQALVTLLSPTAESFPLIQSFAVGDLAGAAFLADSGRVVACFTEKYTRCKHAGFGTSVVREPCTNEQLRRLTAQLVAGLTWHGIGHLDFIVPTDGPPVLLEMNPRFWGALQMAVVNGYDFPLALLEQTVGGKVQPECFAPRLDAVPCLWIAGEVIACVEELRNGLLCSPLRSITRVLNPGILGRYDDFRWDDPFPLLAELSFYGAGFIRSGGDSNPVSAEMLK